jgi:hypothetical protein
LLENQRAVNSWVAVFFWFDPYCEADKVEVSPSELVAFACTYSCFFEQ